MTEHDEDAYIDAVTESFVPGDALAAMVDDWSMPETVETVADLEGRYLGEAETPEAWAEEYMRDTGLLAGIDDDLARYFDYKAWLHDAVLSGDISIVRTTGGVGVFHN